MENLNKENKDIQYHSVWSNDVSNFSLYFILQTIFLTIIEENILSF